MKNEGWILAPQDKFAGYLKEVVKFNEVLGVGDLEGAIVKQEGLVEEETKEALAEWEAGNKAGFVKECCDLFIVAGYRGVLEGLRPELIIEELEESIVNDIVYRWTHRDAFGPATAAEALTVLVNLDCDWAGAMEDVLESNMSKFSIFYSHNVELYNQHSHHLLATNVGRYEAVTWQQCGHLVVWTDSNGKILKGPDYFKACMGEFM